MNTIYSYWDTSRAYSDWEKPRPWEKRFKSERYFLEKIFKPDMSILDIGCATGDLHIGLQERFGEHEYAGTDTSPVMIEGAKKFNPDTRFFVGDIVINDMLGDEQFDIVTATGVFQHEPARDELLTAMLRHTKDGGYVLFDCKLFHTHPSISDIDVAYCDLPDRLFFNVFNIKDALDWLMAIQNISSIEFFGYYSGTHKSVCLPDSVTEEVCSAHILLCKEAQTEGPPQIKATLPAGFRSI